MLSIKIGDTAVEDVPMVTSGKVNRGIKLQGPGDRGFTNVSSAPSVPSVLVEPFFGSSPSECRIALNRTTEYVEGLIDAFIKFAT